MNVKELVEHCSDAMRRNSDVQLVVPREPRGERISLFGRGKPLGEICCVNDGATVAWFKPKEVLLRLARGGVIRMLETSGNTMTFEIIE